MRVSQPPVGCPVLRQEIRKRIDRANDGAAVGDHLAGEALAHLDPRAEHARRRGSGETGHDQLVAVEKPEPGVVDIEQPHGLFGHARQQGVGGRQEADLLVHLEQR